MSQKVSHFPHPSRMTFPSCFCPSYPRVIGARDPTLILTLTVTLVFTLVFAFQEELQAQLAQAEQDAKGAQQTAMEAKTDAEAPLTTNLAILPDTGCA